jgi:hypothetical protein
MVIESARADSAMRFSSSSVFLGGGLRASGNVRYTIAAAICSGM